MAVRKENKAIETQKKKPLELKPRNEKFVQLYAISGNATQSYIEAYGLDKNNISQYMGAGASATRLLKNVKICQRLNQLLTLAGFSDEGVDLQLNQLIQQHDDKTAKLGAIREYNKLRKRTETSKTTFSGNTFNLSSLLDQANIIEVKPE